MCNYLCLYIYPEGQTDYPLEWVNFLERALLLLLRGVIKKPCGLFLDCTHTHTPVHHTYIHMNVTHMLHARKYSSHTNTSHTRMSHKHTYVTDTHVHTHVPQHVSTSTMIHTPFSSCLSGPFAHIGMLTSVNDGSTAINQVSQEALSEKFTILPVGKCARWAFRMFGWLCNQQGMHPSRPCTWRSWSCVPSEPQLPHLPLSVSGSGDLPFCFLSLWISATLRISHGSSVKQSHLPVQEMRVQSAGHGDPLEKGTADPLQDSGLGSAMHRGAWRATAHGVTKRDLTEQARTHRCPTQCLSFCDWPRGSSVLWLHML